MELKAMHRVCIVNLGVFSSLTAQIVDTDIHLLIALFAYSIRASSQFGLKIDA
jgi:hypothetical protein